MSKLLTMDESGNTQKIAALCLVSASRSILSQIQDVLTISPADPPEILTLYHDVMKGEFKYVNFRNAFNNTGLSVYDRFLQSKLQAIARLDLEIYYTVFPTPQNNQERLFRLQDEAQYLFHLWAHHHPQDALDPALEIMIDQQIFYKKRSFQYSIQRGRPNVLILDTSKQDELIKKGVIRRTLFARGKCNVKEILDGSSKTHKTIQLSDMLVGCIRERYVRDDTKYYELIENLVHKHQKRVQLDSYELPPLTRI